MPRLRPWLVYAVIYSFFLATLGYAEVRKATQPDIEWGPYTDNVTSAGRHIGGKLPRYFDTNAFIDNLALHGKSVTGDGSGSITGFNIPLYITQSLSVYDALTAWVDVRAYGAVGDNTTDDYAAFVSAISAINMAGGGILFIPKGIYKLSSGVSIGSNTWVLGAGIGSTIINNLNVTPSTDIAFDVRGVRGSAYPINANTEYDNTVTTTTASNAGNFSAGDNVLISGDDVSGGAVKGFITRVVTAAAGTGVVTVEDRLTRGDYTYISKLTSMPSNVKFSDFQIYKSKDSGILIQYARDIAIENIKIGSEVTSAGIQVNLTRNGNVRNVYSEGAFIVFYSVNGGSLTGSTVLSNKFFSGISLSLEGGCEGVSVVGNTFTDIVTTGVYINLSSKGNRVIGNSFLNCSGSCTGVLIDGYAEGDGDNYIAGNTISGAGSGAGGAGVSIQNNTNNNIITGNNIRNITYGILMGTGDNDNNISSINNIRNTLYEHSYSGATSVFRGFEVVGKFNYGNVITLTENDTTPSIKKGSMFWTNSTNPTTITDFIDGVMGQRITVIVIDNNTTLDFSSSFLKGNSSNDLMAELRDSLDCVYDTYYWHCQVSKVH